MIDRLLTGSRVRKALIERNIRLVVYIARKFDNTGIGLEDLISIGTIGLIKAVNTFDTSKNIKLATYASRCIENEILMYLRRSVRIKTEVSLDEPLNVDWDGNELLLSDILGTESDIVFRQIENDVEHSLIEEAVSHLPPGINASSACALAFPAIRSRHKSRWRMPWAFPRAISPAWKSASSSVCSGMCRKCSENNPTGRPAFSLP